MSGGLPELFTEGALRVAEATLNRLLRFDPDLPARLAPLAGQRLDVAITDLPRAVAVHFHPDGIELAAAGMDATPAHARIEGTAAGLATLALSRGERSREVAFHGDVGVIQAVKRLLAEVELDWEETLSQVVGDVIAHRIGESVRGGDAWLRRAGDTAARNLGEYLTEERRALPTAAEMESFLAAVGRLRQDTDRLEARLRQLEKENM